MEAADWDARYAEDGLLWSAQPNRFLVSEAEDLEPGTALDVACGEGRNALWLASRGWRVTAFDYSPVGLDKGRALAEAAGLEIDWAQADVSTYEPPGAFDLVIVMYLHLPPDQLATGLGRAAGAVGEGGRLLVVGHHTDNIERGVGGPQVPEVLYRPDDIAERLDGFAIERAEMVERPVEGHALPALDTLVRARRA